MKKTIFAALCVAAAVVHGAHVKEDFKINLAGIAVSRMDDSLRYARPESPDSALVVPQGQLAAFFIEYDFPTDVKSCIYMTANHDNTDAKVDTFGFSASKTYSGQGRIMDVVFIMNPLGDKPLRLTSVRFEGEIAGTGGSPRNRTFFICDKKVDIVFSQAKEFDRSSIVTLKPAPVPADDPTLGVIAPGSISAPVVPAYSIPRGFTDNMDEALDKAKAEGKLVYACFSGSDWCHWCQVLEREVLSKPEFLKAMQERYVLVFIDSPMDKSILGERVREANPKLVEKYGVDCFPTSVIIDADGKRLAAMAGYMNGGPEAYVKSLKALAEAK